MELKDILYEIKINKNDKYYYELLQNNKIRGLIQSVVKRHKSNKDIIYAYAVSALYELTMFDYRYHKNYTEANYVSFINVCLRRRVAKMVQKDCIPNTCSYEYCYKNKIYQNIDIGEENFYELVRFLSEKEQYIIYKLYRDKYTEQEIADELGVSQQAVHKNKEKILKKVKKMLKKKEN